MPKSIFFNVTVAFLISLLAHHVLAGPDPSFLHDCAKFLSSLTREQRVELKSAVQSIHALSSRVGLEKLNPAANVSRIKEFESLLESIRSKSGAGLDTAVQCLAHRLTPDAYHGRPVFSILLEYFKRPWGIYRMAQSLRDACARASLPCELVVNVDNPHEAGAWAEVVHEFSGFVVPVFSANMHEARGYNRAAKLARGKYLIVWQDDQLPPSSSSAWLNQLIAIFQAWPQLAVVGMNTYRLCKDFEPTNRFLPTTWEPDPRTGVRWSFVQLVDFAPLVMRASAFGELGGLEEGFSRQGDCGIWGDWELSTRAWLEGWQVGFLHLQGREGDGHQGGTHTSANAERCWGRQQGVASGSFRKRFGQSTFMLEMCEKVRQLNLASFRLAQPKDCPYGMEDTQYGNCTLPYSSGS